MMRLFSSVMARRILISALSICVGSRNLRPSHQFGLPALQRRCCCRAGRPSSQGLFVPSARSDAHASSTPESTSGLSTSSSRRSNAARFSAALSPAACSRSAASRPVRPAHRRQSLARSATALRRAAPRSSSAVDQLCHRAAAESLLTSASACSSVCISVFMFPSCFGLLQAPFFPVGWPSAQRDVSRAEESPGRSISLLEPCSMRRFNSCCLRDPVCSASGELVSSRLANSSRGLDLIQ